tara:strand:- start:493 stop:660 length:168 start_codon:yes stop_codon:yes gene_type:complete
LIDSYAISYEIINEIIHKIPEESMPQVVHLDPLALEIQQILDKHLQSDVKTVNSS